MPAMNAAWMATSARRNTRDHEGRLWAVLLAMTAAPAGGKPPALTFCP